MPAVGPRGTSARAYAGAGKWRVRRELTVPQTMQHACFQYFQTNDITITHSPSVATMSSRWRHAWGLRTLSSTMCTVERWQVRQKRSAGCRTGADIVNRSFSQPS